MRTVAVLRPLAVAPQRCAVGMLADDRQPQLRKGPKSLLLTALLASTLTAGPLQMDAAEVALFTPRAEPKCSCGPMPNHSPERALTGSVT